MPVDKNRPVTFLVTPTKRKKAGSACKGTRPASFRSKACYWIAVPPEGDALSLPPEPIELVACQIVPVVLVKK